MAATGKKKPEQQGKQKRKIIIFAIEIVIILVMLGVLWLVMQVPDEGPKRVEFDPANIGIPTQIKEDKESGESPMLGYMNVALFGVDARTGNELYKDSRSDSMMIASINLDTGDIKLVSIYRDTMLDLCQDKYAYQKCNAGYFYGGAQQAVKMLNTNLDMDIETFVTVNYKGLSELIDELGGIWLNVDEIELKHINNYQIDIARVLQCDYDPVTSVGYQKLNGLQASAYCRIRYGGGDDFRRASRQREVIRAIEKEAKTKDLTTLTKVFEKVIDDIYTNITNEQILELLGNIMKYRIVEEVDAKDENANGFPQKDLRTVVNLDNIDGWAVGSTIVPLDLEANVVWLHHFLFEDEDYTVTEKVREISETIKVKTKPYVESKQ